MHQLFSRTFFGFYSGIAYSLLLSSLFPPCCVSHPFSILLYHIMFQLERQVIVCSMYFLNVVASHCRFCAPIRMCVGVCVCVRSAQISSVEIGSVRCYLLLALWFFSFRFCSVPVFYFFFHIGPLVDEYKNLKYRKKYERYGGMFENAFPICWREMDGTSVKKKMKWNVKNRKRKRKRRKNENHPQTRTK